MKNKLLSFLTSPYILILIAVATYFRWMSFSIFSSGDWWYFPQQTMTQYFPLSIWYGLFGLGGVDITLWRIPVINIPFGIFGNLGFGQEIAEKFTVFLPSLIIGNISIYLLAKKVFKSTIASTISTIVFNYNTYYLTTTHFLLYAADAWAVLSLFFFIEAIEKKKLYFALLTGLAVSISSSYDLRGAYIIIIVLFAYYIYQGYLSTKGLLKYISETFVIVLISITTFILLNLYWILPLINSSSLTNNVVLSRTLFGNEFLNIMYAITLYHPFWTGTHSAIFDPQPIPLYFWILPMIAFVGLIVTWKERQILFFGFLALLGILLTKQVGEPFTDLYQFLFSHLPGFSAFREASKFYFLIVLGYAILIGSFVNWLQSNYSNKSQKKTTNIVIIIIACLFLWNIKPFITGEIGTMFVPRSIPSDYQYFNDYLLHQPYYSRTLWLPIFPRWAVNTNNHPSYSAAETLVDWSNLIQRENESASYSSGELMLILLKKNISNNLLDLSSIQYVVVPAEEQKSEDFFPDYAIKRQVYIDQLNKLDYLQKISVGTREIVVYENKRFKPLIYTTKEKISIKRVSDWQDVQYSFISPSEYTFTLKNISDPVFLNFSENYHSQWQLKVGEVNWFKVIFQKDYFYLSINHVKNDIGFNTFRVDPREICKVSRCIRNKDGSYNMSLTLFFKPQAYFYLGAAISVVTIIIAFSYLLFIIGKYKVYDKKNK